MYVKIDVANYTGSACCVLQAGCHAGGPAMGELGLGNVQQADPVWKRPGAAGIIAPGPGFLPATPPGDVAGVP